MTGEWKLVQPPKKRTVRAQGVNNAGVIKAVPRKKIVAAFVSRMNAETIPNDITQHLASVGIPDVVCRKITLKDGKIFKTAAFFVSHDEKHKDLFYNDSSWPEGAEVRDWVFHTN